MDPSIVRIMFNVNNTARPEANKYNLLRPLSGAWRFSSEGREFQQKVKLSTILANITAYMKCFRIFHLVMLAKIKSPKALVQLIQTQIPFQIVSNATDCVIRDVGDDVIRARVDAAATTVIRRVSWSLTDCRLLCDLLQLDNETENGYTQHLLNGIGLEIPYNDYISSYQSTIGGGDGQKTFVLPYLELLQG